jgi:hypothetical protein
MSSQINRRGVLPLRAADIFLTPFQQIFAAFCVLMTDFCISLSFHISASKFQKLLITANAAITEACCHFAPPKQTKSKGNFCLITVYNHKNFLQPQNSRAKKQTFSNFCPLSPLRKERVGVWGYCHFAPPTAPFHCCSALSALLLHFTPLSLPHPPEAAARLSPQTISARFPETRFPKARRILPDGACRD